MAPVSISIEEAAQAFGPRSAVSMASTSRVGSARARTELGWSAQGPSLVDDLTQGSYRRVWAFKEPAMVRDRDDHSNRVTTAHPSGREPLG
jgi:hypothetical protein